MAAGPTVPKKNPKQPRLSGTLGFRSLIDCLKCDRCKLAAQLYSNVVLSALFLTDGKPHVNIQ